MSEIYIVWAEDAHKAQARMDIITDGENFVVVSQGDAELIQAEDIDESKSLDSGGARHCIVFKLV